MSSNNQPLSQQDIASGTSIHLIANQLRYGLVLLVVFSVLASGGILIYFSFQAQLQQLLLVQQERSRTAASEINAYVDDLQRKITYLSRVTGLSDLPFEIQQNLLTGLVQHNSAYQTVAILDDTGRVEAIVSVAGLPELPESLADTVLFNRAYNRQEDYVGPVEIDPATKLPVVNLAVPIRNWNNEVDGVLLTQIDLSFLWIIVSQVKTGETGYTYVLDNRNILLAETGTTPEGFTLQNISDRPFVQVLNTNDAETLTTYQGLRDVSVIGRQSPIQSVRWKVVTELPTFEAYAPIRNLLLGMGLVLVVATGLAVTFSIFLTRRIVNPLQQLTEASAQVSRGNMDIEVQLNTHNEMQLLATTFNTMTAQVRSLVQGLESRTHRLEIIANLSEQLTAILNLEQLLATVVRQTQDNFGYYHAQIYLLDEPSQYLLVAEGTGPVGVEMKAQRYRIPLSDPVHPVARAARSGQIVSVDNIREVQGWQPNPLLPDAYAQIAVPITIEGRRVGVFDVLEDDIAGLDAGDATLLRSLANQVAVAIRNARLFAQVEQALADAYAVQARYTNEAWGRVRQTTPYVYTQPDARVLPAATLAQTKRQALGLSQTTILSQTGDSMEDAPNHAVLAAPVRLGEHKIGTFQLHRTDVDQEQPLWTDDDLALIEAILDQVAQTAENLRLFEETQERATREQTLREITDKLRATPNLDTLLETAARELGQRLGVRHTVLELGIEANRDGHN